MDEAAGASTVEPDRFDLREILPRIRPRAHLLLARQRIPGQDADDLLQQALLALLRHREAVRDPEAWLLGTLRNKCRRYWKGRRERSLECLDPQALERVLRPVAPEQAHHDLRHDLELLLARIPERCRTVLRYRFVLGLRATEVAEILDCPASSVRQAACRGLRALHREIDALAGPG